MKITDTYIKFFKEDVSNNVAEAALALYWDSDIVGEAQFREMKKILHTIQDETSIDLNGFYLYKVVPRPIQLIFKRIEKKVSVDYFAERPLYHGTANQYKPLQAFSRNDERFYNSFCIFFTDNKELTKLFGDHVYEPSSKYLEKYCIFEDSVLNGENSFFISAQHEFEIEITS